MIIPKDSPLLAPYPHINMLGLQKYPTASAGLKNHRNTGIEICYVPRGEFHWQVEGKPFTVSSGEGFLTFPWQWHGGQSDIMNRGELFWVILEVEHHEQTVTDLGTWSRLRGDQEILRALNALQEHRLGTVPEMGRLFRALAREISGRLPGQCARVNALLEELLVLVARLKRPALPAKEARFRQVNSLVQKIQADPSAVWSLAEICTHLGLERSAAIRAFCAVTGLTPKAFVLKTKLDRAEHLLSHTDRSITSIGLELGFSSSQHFSDAFHRNKGRTPSSIPARF